MNKNKKNINAFTFPEMAISLILVSIVYLGMMFMYGEIARQIQQDDLVESVRESLYVAMDEIAYEMQQGCDINITPGFLGSFRIEITGFVDGDRNNPVNGINESGEEYTVVYTSNIEDGIYKYGEPMDLYGNKYIGDTGAYIITIENFKCNIASDEGISLANDLDQYVRILDVNFKLQSKNNTYQKDFNFKKTIFNMNHFTINTIDA